MRSKILKRIRREAGDTLIEVTMALSILSMVLISSTVLATQAFRLGQTARERTTLAVSAQGQVEAARAFRDNNSWDHFLNGSAGAPQPGPSRDADSLPYHGVLSATSNVGCHTADPCMHMESSGHPTFVPADGTMAGPINTSYIEMVATPGPGSVPQYVDVTINYGFEALGTGNYTGHIKTRYTNLGFTAPTPIPMPSLPPPASPTPAPDEGGDANIDGTECSPLPACLAGPPPGGSYRYVDALMNVSPPGLTAVSCLWNWGDGTTTANQGCKSGDVVKHTWPAMSGLRPYPLDCDKTSYIATLTVEYSNGAKAKSNTYYVGMPECY